MVPAYNPGPLLAVTLQAARSATAGRSDVEIVVVDDCSTEALDPGQLPPDVRLERNPKNLGAIGNFNRALELATGEFVHLLHADDLISPGFYETMERGFMKFGAAAGVCGTQEIDGAGAVMNTFRSERDTAGIWDDALAVLAVSNRVAASSIAVRRSLYTEIGGFDGSLSHAADWDMWVRIAAAAPMYYDPAVLASYRVHADQHTASVLRTGDNIRQAHAVIDRLTTRIDDGPRARRLQAKAYAHRALYATRTAGRAVRVRDAGLAVAQVRAAAQSLWLSARHVVGRSRIR